jgi:molecular chaperone GrpE
LSPDAIGSILADFRSWLQQAASAPAATPSATTEEELLDLHTLLAQFVALRHEVNLQTKANRAQQEQTAAALEQLSRSLELLEQQPAPSEADRQARDEALRALLKTLVDVHEALTRAEREVRRIRDEILATLEEKSSSALSNGGETELTASARPRKFFFSKWFGGQRPATISGHQQPSPQQLQPEPVDRIHALLDSILTGYTMSVQRIERSLAQAGLEPIPCVGQPFDPELMEVVAVAPDSGRAAGEVIEEVRPGYLWRGRVFRYAQVSVAKS